MTPNAELERVMTGGMTLAFDMPETVESVVRCRENGPLIATAAQLWIEPDDLVVDVTHGLGNFWTQYRPARFTAHDLKLDGVDFCQLPEADGSIDVVVFDPPYIAQGGRDTSTVPDMLGRYGLVDVPKTAPELQELIAAGIAEAVRVLAPKGRLLVKCMDYINGGRLVLGRHHVVTTALELGLEQSRRVRPRLRLRTPTARPVPATFPTRSQLPLRVSQRPLAFEGAPIDKVGTVTQNADSRGVIQRYDDAGGDAIISDGGWWCEHENADGTPAPPARMTDPGEMERVECSDCGTVWMPWTYGGKRLAKAVVVAI